MASVQQQQQQAQQASMVVPPLYYSIDVECVATGTDHNSRAVAQIALVDQYEQVVLNLYVKPEKPVVSYLTALTGITRDVVEQYGRPLDEQVGSGRVPGWWRCARLVGVCCCSGCCWCCWQGVLESAGSSWWGRSTHWQQSLLVQVTHTDTTHTRICHAPHRSTS
jgi:hypothetical protein